MLKFHQKDDKGHENEDRANEEKKRKKITNNVPDEKEEKDLAKIQGMS